MMEETLPNTPVTFTVVELGTTRNKTKLVSSDGYEYTRRYVSRFPNKRNYM